MARALILGGGLSALGVARSLDLAQIKSEIVCAPSDWASYSRSISRLHHVDNSDSLRSQFLSVFSDNYVLMPCADDWLRLINSPTCSTSLQAKYLAIPHATIESFIEKDRFAALLASLAIPHPETIVIPPEESYASLQSRFTDSFFLKPIDSQRFFKQFQRKAFEFSDPTSSQLYASAQQLGLRFVAQQLIPGGPKSHFFIDGCCDSAGKIVAAFARQRLRIYPPRFGNSTSMTSIPLAQLSRQLDQLRNLFSSVGYAGLFSAEWKLDPQGEMKLLEVNARAWWYCEFATRCGLNLPLIYFRLALGERETGATDYRVTKSFFHPYYDLHALREESPAPLCRWMRQFVQSDNSHFLWRDPAPAILASLRWCAASLTKLVNCLVQWFPHWFRET